MSDSTVAEVAAQRLQAAIDARVRAEIAEAVAIAEYATAHEWHGDDPIDVVGTRPVRVGADGTPLLGEFVALELAVLKRISPTTATWLIRDILNLRDRHPQLWQQVQHGDLPVYRACQLVQEVARWGLDADQARQLDSLLAPKVGRLGWPRLLRLCRGLMCQIAPQRAIDTARGARADRYVRKAPAEDPAVSYLTARVDTADAIFFDAMIDRIADLLSRQGDQDTKEIRRQVPRHPRHPHPRPPPPHPSRQRARRRPARRRAADGRGVGQDRGPPVARERAVRARDSRWCTGRGRDAEPNRQRIAGRDPARQGSLSRDRVRCGRPPPRNQRARHLAH